VADTIIRRWCALIGTQNWALANEVALVEPGKYDR
jgi:hypothetical protein